MIQKLPITIDSSVCISEEQNIRLIKLKINEIIDYVCYAAGSHDCDEELMRTIQLNLRDEK
jgi:hypothetical protein